MLKDTIAAISTPLGESGIGIVRVSGDDAFYIAGKIFKAVNNKDWAAEKGHRLIYGYVCDPDTGDIIDEILLGVMRAPYTYTREDIVEFNCHGGIVPLRKTLELLLRHGARLAEAGEFTKRAFLNGRLDLAQAESVIDVIRSKTGTGLNIALNQLEGRFSAGIRELQQDLLDVLANIEVSIDFSEEELGADTAVQLKDKTNSILQKLEKLLESAEIGKVYREGVHTVIAGKPNVGKSSLLNALLRDRRAIVTEIPGTTRDVIEEVLNIKGIPIRLVDTAGLRNTDDVVERMGVERSRESLIKAEFILLVLDAQAGITAEDKEIIEAVGEKKGISVINKIDVQESSRVRNYIEKELSGWPAVEISALNEEGLSELENTIEDAILGGDVQASESQVVSNARHKEALHRAFNHVQEVLKGLEADTPVDLLAIDVREAWEALGEITGDTVTEDLVDKIFADFCVGK